jgi:hypothetical protein
MQEVLHRRVDSVVSLDWDEAALLGQGEEWGLHRWGCTDG